MKVAVAVITDIQKRFLIAQRPPHVSHPGLWEFPGGKLEEDESPAIALLREVREEVGLEVVDYQFLGEVNYDYSDKKVHLLVFHVKAFQGEPLCLENQPQMNWVPFSHLKDFEFPAANKQIIELIRNKLL
ncbi:Mutator protein MutT (plasmid) [Legionella adelaidensis]|uniref:8-oxo-dGTP diphosphatase n=1 Tax=Legionella adelaidensis TaxID=45056 RepID=A0A0W0R3N1_9GAMM|nr:(deoxy)nucleoside triphosphate pyrophosphohydrolase [Legionella adelaidensis]KTC65655.1 Mutator protein MutT [Legionella adelaidensis]VEH85149.1 Mutator protein MutT [Legionella adelaidensis]